MDVEEMLLEDFIGSDSVEKVRGNIFKYSFVLFKLLLLVTHTNKPNTHRACFS